MDTRVPVQHYNLRSANPYLGSSLHDLNTVDDDRPGDIDGIGSHDVVTDDSLDNGDESDCLHESYRSSLPLHGVDVEEDHSNLENNCSSGGPYSFLSIEDVSPVETARSRFLDIIVDHFINSHVTEVQDFEADFTAHSAQDKLSKRKSREIRCEGDVRFILPLMYVANMYETLANEVNVRLSSMNGMREKTISVALEAAGGLYRKLARKFPRKGSCIFKRRELATSLETRSRFPELVIQEEKRVRFVVVNGTVYHAERKDSTMFKKLTGRNEVAVSARDYKFYAPRHKYRRVASNSVSNIPDLPTFPGSNNTSPMATSQSYRTFNEAQNQQQTPLKQNSHTVSHQSEFHLLQQSHHQPVNQSQHAVHFSQNHQCGPPSHLPEIAHSQQSSTISQHMACLQPLGHVGGRVHVLPTSPAKFCDDCGAPFLRETSKFCSECGVKRFLASDSSFTFGNLWCPWKRHHATVSIVHPPGKNPEHIRRPADIVMTFIFALSTFNLMKASANVLTIFSIQWSKSQSLLYSTVIIFSGRKQRGEKRAFRQQDIQQLICLRSPRDNIMKIENRNAFVTSAWLRLCGELDQVQTIMSTIAPRIWLLQSLKTLAPEPLEYSPPCIARPIPHKIALTCKCRSLAKKMHQSTATKED
ncbi:hypothetical protein RJ639_002752 [Escallonia herrerae]|uniref:Uncharacterized protein n=1 Tax=Escallonia herrerae TaxID=1293975 RepID=A0AA88W2M3_9ASTE|nr:hypothetical protein RJ639_002752 [Escallonia herrerae]